MMNFRTVLTTAAAMALLAACVPPPGIPAGESVIEIDDAYIVQPAAGMDIAGAGMTVTVQGAPRTLVSAQSTIADKIEFHTMSMDGGRMSMRRLPTMDVSAAAPLVLERGGDHLMLFGVKSLPLLGETVDIVLTFENEKGDQQDVLATARVVAPGG
jgi:periplasmic copper chaperone A